MIALYAGISITVICSISWAGSTALSCWVVYRGIGMAHADVVSFNAFCYVDRIDYIRWLAGFAFFSCGVEFRGVSIAVNGNTCQKGGVKISFAWASIAFSTCFIEQFS